MQLYNLSHIEKSNNIAKHLLQFSFFFSEPPAPRSVSISELSSTSITISVSHNVHAKYSLDVYINGNFSLSQFASEKFLITTITINHLTPGAIYNNIKVFANYKGLRSKGVATIIKQCTLRKYETI